ncbi:hypothetical protein RYA05_01160 [Pseudomonas syringae pv. actinidiae]|nr:hypothetical protein [Pseudomonas syringae pv. actinidiae]
MEKPTSEHEAIASKAIADINEMCKSMSAKLDDMTNTIDGMSKEQAVMSASLDKSFKRLRLSTVIFSLIFVCFLVGMGTVSTLAYLKYQSAKDAISQGITTLHEKAEAAKPIFKSFSLTKKQEQ